MIICLGTGPAVILNLENTGLCGPRSISKQAKCNHEWEGKGDCKVDRFLSASFVVFVSHINDSKNDLIINNYRIAGQFGLNL